MASRIYFQDEKIVECNILEMIGDGACLFRSISYHVYGTESRHYDVRREIVEHVVNHFSDFQIYTVDRYGNPYSSQEEYKTAMSSPSEYGANSELRAAGFIYISCRFCVFLSGKHVATFGEGPE